MKLVSDYIKNSSKKVLSNVIDTSQSVFLKDRILLDSVVVANETVYEAKLNKKKSIIVKVNFEKV